MSQHRMNLNYDLPCFEGGLRIGKVGIGLAKPEVEGRRKTLKVVSVKQQQCYEVAPNSSSKFWQSVSLEASIIIKSPIKMDERPKKNHWSEPFVFVTKLSQFRAIPGGNQQPKSRQVKRQAPKKSQIAVPGFEIVKKKKGGQGRPPHSTSQISCIPLHYIRITQDLTLPHIYSYELSDHDLAFLNQSSEKAKTRKNPITIDEATLESCIMFLETGAAEYGQPAQFQIEDLADFLQDQYPDKPDNKIHTLCNIIWKYWVDRRRRLGAPLLREFNRPHETNKDTHLAYRHRIKKTQLVQSRGKKKQYLSQITDYMKTIKLCGSVAATARIRQGTQAEEMREKFHSFNRYMNRLTGMRKASVFAEPYLSSDVSQFENYLRLNQGIFQLPRFAERRSPQDRNLVDFFLGLYNIATELNLDLTGTGKMAHLTKLVEAHRRSFSISTSKDLDEMTRMLGLEMSKLSLEPVPEEPGLGRRSSRSQNRPRKYYNLKHRTETESTMLYSLRANDQSEEDFARIPIRPKNTSADDRNKKVLNQTETSEENENGYRLRPRKQ